MVERRPRSDGKAGGLESGSDVVGETGLHVDDLADGMETRALHGIPGAQVVVEDAGDDLDEGAPEPSASGGADSES